MPKDTRGQIIYHNRSSADFDIYVTYPFDPPHPEMDITATHINGRNGDILQSYDSYKNITLTVPISARIPMIYTSILQWQQSVMDWLTGNSYDYLKFNGNADWLWEAIVVTPPTFTQNTSSSSRRDVTGTITFTCKPLMKRADGIHWQAVPNIDVANDVWSTVLYNQTNMLCYPDWHIKTDGKGNGNWNIIVNGQTCSLDNIESEIYIDGENCQAYKSPDNPVNLNSNCQFWNNDAPALKPGKNTIEFRGNNLGKIEYKPNWRRLA